MYPGSRGDCSPSRYCAVTRPPRISRASSPNGALLNPPSVFRGSLHSLGLRAARKEDPLCDSSAPLPLYRRPPHGLLHCNLGSSVCLLFCLEAVPGVFTPAARLTRDPLHWWQALSPPGIATPLQTESLGCVKQSPGDTSPYLVDVSDNTDADFREKASYFLDTRAPPEHSEEGRMPKEEPEPDTEEQGKESLTTPMTS
ncbi:hypothetical protein NDU88_001441 [Pleurodeles waltl]|uniref:Uncharacterized protein n=1 Tax=Pleurodeles waltl TaxID=8319 RepID=A0AAV7NCG0_PLEWA|nr:hypothetical protein NDU88_001441 [Pleurodeles waltl]